MFNQKINPAVLIISVLLFFLSGPALADSRDHRLISDTLDVVHYSIHLDIMDLPSHNIGGFTEVSITTYYDNTDIIYLELLQLEIDSVFVDGVMIQNYNHIDPLLVIALPAPIDTEDTILIRIHYHGVPFHEGWGGFHYSASYAYNLGVGFDSDPHNLGKAWFPCIDDFHDRATYDCFIRVDEGYTAVCGGSLESETNNGDGTVTFHWYMNNPIPTYLASVAVGNYILINDTYEGAERDIPIDYWIRPVDSIYIEGFFVHMHDILAIYESHFGPYDWNRVGYVSTYIGAMEHATNVAFPWDYWSSGLSSEWLYAHELSHMWFGDKVTCASAEDMWINEGWAVFCESVFLDEVYGEGSYINNINALHAEVLQFCHTMPPHGDGQYFALYGIPTEFTYGTTVYDKGGIVTHTLRGYLGDELFFSGVQGFLEEFAFDYMSSEDMRDFFTNHSGIDMTGFFDAWVFSPGFPHFSVDSFHVSPTGPTSEVTVYAKQKLKGTDHYASSNRIEVTFMDNDWNSYTDLLQFSEINGSQIFQVPFIPTAVFLDLNDLICDATTDDEHVVTTTGDILYDNTFFTLETTEISDSGYVRVTHNWVPPDSLNTPVNGLRLSDYRYWKIDGIFPGNFIATGKFKYSKGYFLDNTLITNSSDSLVILYRPDPSEEWQSIDFIKVGNWIVGNMWVNNLQPGEYTLAVWNQPDGTGDMLFPSDVPLKLFPNPSEDNFTFEFNLEEKARISIYNNEGKLIDNFPLDSGRQIVNWHPVTDTNGIYYVHLYSLNNRILASDKLIYIK